ncbi:reverse transcriptase domain-containing protein [Tanacetum coccineum]
MLCSLIVWQFWFVTVGFWPVIEVSKHVNVALGSNSATRTPNVVNASLDSFLTVSEAHGIHSPASANEENMNDDGTKVGPTTAGNTPGISSYANVSSIPSRKALNFRTLFTPAGKGDDVVVLVESIRAISERIFSFQFSSIDGLDAVLQNGPWFIRNNSLILKKWNLDVNLLKEYVGNVPVWNKIHGDPVTGFSEDGLSSIPTKLGTPLMLDSYTSDMCIQSWGRSSYARALIKVRADVELKDNIVVAMPILVGEGYYTCNNECLKNVDSDVVKNMKKPSQATRGILVGPKMKDPEPTIEVSNSNPFDVLNSVENDVYLGTNGGTSNLASKKGNSSGSLFWNVESSSTSTNLIVEKIDQIERLIIDRNVTLVDDEGKPLANDDSSETYENDDYNFDPYDDDMYEGQDIPDKIQAICDNLDIKVRGRKKK